MSIATSSQYDQNKWEVKRLVTANHTEAVSLARGFVAGIVGIFGGPSDSMNQKMDDVVNQLKAKIEAQIGPGECVVGFQIQFAEFGRSESNTFLSGSGAGTLLTPKMGGILAPMNPIGMGVGSMGMGMGGKRTRKNHYVR